MFFPSLSDVGEDLGEGVASNGGSMDQDSPPRELRLLQKFQDLQPIAEPPSRPQEVRYAALDDKDIHATIQVKVPVLGNGSRLGTKPGEEQKKRTGSWGNI